MSANPNPLPDPRPSHQRSYPYDEAPALPAFPEEQEWLAVADEPIERGAGGRAVLGWALTLLAAGWLGYAAWSAGQSLAGTPLTSPLVAQWVAIVTGPLALLGLTWLMFGRTRRREAEAFTRSVVTMRGEAKSLEALLSVLRARIDENHGALRRMADQLMGLGDEAAARLGSVTADLDEGSRRLSAQGEALDRAALSARNDIGVLLDDLPRAEATTRAMADLLRAAGQEAGGHAADFQRQVELLSERARDADTVVTQATERLTLQLAAIERGSDVALGRLAETSDRSAATIDAVLQRSAEALDEIRGAIEVQAQAVAALVTQSEAGLGKVGLGAAEALGGRLADANSQLDTIAARVADQDSAAQRMFATIGTALSALEGQLAAFAEQGDARAALVSQSLDRVRSELGDAAAASGVQDKTLVQLADRTASLKQSLERLTEDVRGQLGAAIGEAEGSAARLLATTESASPAILVARNAAVEASGRLERGAEAIEAQHERLANLLAAVDTGVGGAEKRLGELSEAIAKAEGEAGRLSQETGPALVAALVQVREASAHAAERAREAIANVIPDSASGLSDAARASLEKAVRETVAEQMAEIERVAGQAVEAARGASERLMQQMLSIGQSAAALEAHFTDSREAQQQRDSEAFAKRVSLLIDSMHSASIDVGKILSDEVDDKAWASYLKGDRGVFTRRAVRLIGSGEGRDLAAHYESDREFHDSVNRYVHDFEAMLRRVSAERDGGPLAVTLMASDMGKLYTALAPVAGGRR